MNMQNASWVKWTGLTVSLALLAGCVINPYVKAPTAPKALAGSECKALGGAIISAGAIRKDSKDGLDHAMAYAICTQRAMERKAGKYAWMNQGGALMLMHMAGLAGYSGARGGHAAQVAGLTTGGATFYGAQQYLYRKPREAIYWSGAEAVGCAITVTNRRLIAQGDESVMKEIYERQIDKLYQDLKGVDESELILRGHGKTPASCSSPEDGELMKNWAEQIKKVDNARLEYSLSDLDNARLLANIQLNQLIRQSSSTRSELVDITGAIRLAVNRQLAAQQPDPAELAKLLTGLKLPALAGLMPPSKIKSAQIKEQREGDTFWASTGPETCAGEVDAYLHKAKRFMEIHNDLRNGIDTFTTQFNRIQTETGADPKSQRPIEQCLQLRANTLRPFAVVMAQSGALKVAVGGTARVAIVGGMPPFDAEPLSENSKVSAEAKLNESGEYEFVITVAEDAQDAGDIKVKFFATDDAGGSDMFTVEVVAAP